MEKFQRISNESLLAHYLLIQKYLNDVIKDGCEEKILYEMLDKSKELKDEILRRMENGRKSND